MKSKKGFIPAFVFVNTEDRNGASKRMNTGIKLIASDLDGTLYTAKKDILPFTLEMIKKSIEEGILFVPTTGRPIGSVTSNVLEIKGIKYVICSNGAAIYSLPEMKRIYEKILTAHSVRAISMIEKKDSVAMEAFIRGVPYAEARYVKDPAMFGATEYGVGYVKSTRTPVDDWDTFMRLHENELDSVAYASKDYEALKNIHAKIVEKIPDVYAVWSFSHLLEVGHKEAGKGETLKVLLNILGISAEETLALGDAENDMTLIKTAKYGIAMGNAVDSLKKAAFAVTDTNEEDGVGKAIQKYCDIL